MEPYKFIKKNYLGNNQIVKFLMVGAIGNLVSIFIIYILTSRFGFFYVISQVIGFFFAVTLNFVLNSYVTFNVNIRFIGFVNYLLANIGFLILNILLTIMFTEFLKIYYLYSVIISLFIVFLFSFSISKFHIFKNTLRERII